MITTSDWILMGVTIAIGIAILWLIVSHIELFLRLAILPTFGWLVLGVISVFKFSESYSLTFMEWLLGGGIIVLAITTLLLLVTLCILGYSEWAEGSIRTLRAIVIEDGVQQTKLIRGPDLLQEYRAAQKAREITLIVGNGISVTKYQNGFIDVCQDGKDLYSGKDTEKALAATKKAYAKKH